MNMNNYFSPRLMVGAAVVGIVGAAGVFIYERIYAEKRRAMLTREVARLDMQVSSMRTELQALRELQKETQLRHAKKKRIRQRREQPRLLPAGDAQQEQSYASDSEYFTDYQSVIGTDGEMDSEEFYDVNTDEDDDTLRDSLKNGHTIPTEPLDEDSSGKADYPKSSQNNNSI